MSTKVLEYHGIIGSRGNRSYASRISHSSRYSREDPGGSRESWELLADGATTAEGNDASGTRRPTSGLFRASRPALFSAATRSSPTNDMACPPSVCLLLPPPPPLLLLPIQTPPLQPPAAAATGQSSTSFATLTHRSRASYPVIRITPPPLSSPTPPPFPPA